MLAHVSIPEPPPVQYTILWLNQPKRQRYAQNSLVIKRSNQVSFENQQEIQKVLSFRDLPADWDSYGAEPIDERAIEKAIDFIKNVDLYDQNVYFIAPGPNGEISVELQKGSKNAEFLFYPTQNNFLQFENQELNGKGEFQGDLLKELIQWLNDGER